MHRLLSCSAIAVTAAIVAVAIPSSAVATIWRISFQCSYWPPVFDLQSGISVTLTTKDLPAPDFPRVLSQDDIAAYAIADGVYNTRTQQDCDLGIEQTECAFEFILAPDPDSTPHAYIRAEFKEFPAAHYSQYILIVDTSFQMMSYVHSAFLNDRGMSYTIDNDHAVCSAMTVTRVSGAAATPPKAPHPKKTTVKRLENDIEMAVRQPARGDQGDGSDRSRNAATRSWAADG